MGEAACSVASFSILGSNFIENRDYYFGLYETAVGLGIMTGPIIGQSIYNLVGFEDTFYITALLISIPLIFICICIP